MTYPSETPAQRGPNLIAWIAIGLVALALVGVGWLIYQRQTESAAASSEPVVGTIQSAAAAAAALPKCAAIFVPGEKIDAKRAAAGCLDQGGGVQFLGSFTCPDGRKLYSVDAHTGAPAGWGYGGEKYHAAKDSAADPGYAKAYRACSG